MKHRLKYFLQFAFVFILSSSYLPQRSNAADSQTAVEDVPVSIQVLSFDQTGIELRLSAPAYQITPVQIEGSAFDSLSVPGTRHNQVPGQPELPLANALIGVPPQAQISLEIHRDQPQILTGAYRLPLAPFPARLSEDGNTSAQWDYTHIAERDNLANVQYPAAPVRIAEQAWIRDQRVVRIEYSPFQYDPATGRLTWHPEIDLRLHFDFSAFPAGELRAAQDANTTFESILESSLINYQQAKDWRALPIAQNMDNIPPDYGPRFRVGIQEDGVYKLTYAELAAVNPEIASVDPNNLRMVNQGDEVAIQVYGAQDNSFDPGDYILFYGQRFYGDRMAARYADENLHWRTYNRAEPDGSTSAWKPEFNATMLEKYTHENVYWLYEGDSAGLRMPTIDGDPSGNGNAPVPHYRATVRAEESNEWKTTTFTGEDTWFWELIAKRNTTFPYSTTLTAISSSGPDINVRGEFVSKIHSSNHTEVYLNANLIDDGYWQGMSRYHFSADVDPSLLVEGSNLLEVVALTTTQTSYPQIYFDWFSIEYNRQFKAENNAITFQSDQTGLQKYTVTDFSSTADLHVLDITTPLTPTQVINPQVQPDQVTISLTYDNPIRVHMAAGTKSVPQEQLSYYEPPDWDSLNAGFDYVFITHPDLLTGTQVLADYRSTQGLNSLVVDIEDLYNEFNEGIFNPIAIKNFLAYAFDNWSTAPTYALLVGDGHWNFHSDNTDKYGLPPQFLPPNLAWVDPWQGEVDSPNLLATVVGGDAFADLIIARLPVNSNAEIQAYADKVSLYENTEINPSWEQNHLFIAEDADVAGNFPVLADDVIQQFIDSQTFANPIRIYQDEKGCSSGSSMECQKVRDAITNTINITGTTIVNYIGHAGVRSWSKELIFTVDQIQNLDNAAQLPVILSMTCLDGYWSGPIAEKMYPSLIEELLRKEDAGTIGAFSPTGLGVSTGHDILHKGFYYALMYAGDWELGSAAYTGKLWLYTIGSHLDLLQTYVIFGDPALQIQNPYQYEVNPLNNTKFTEMPGAVISYTLNLENSGAVTDTYQIEVNSTWTTTLPYTQTTEVLPGQEISIPIEVHTPYQENGNDTAMITITSTGDIAKNYQIRLNTYLIKDVKLIFLPLIMSK